MSTNKTAKSQLEKIFGKGCFFKRANIEEKIEKIGTIKTFKKFKEEKRFKSKKLNKKITYHHLKHRSEGGATNLENGANLEEIVHQYIHSLPRDEEEVINNMLREFKINYLEMTGQADIIQHGKIEFTNETEFLEIPVYKQNEKIKEKRKRRKRLTRAMSKKQLRKEIEDELFEK